MAGRHYPSKRSSVALAHLLFSVSALAALWSILPAHVSDSQVFVQGCARSSSSSSATRIARRASGIAVDFKEWADTLTQEEKTAIGTQAKYFYNSSFRKADGHLQDVLGKVADEKNAKLDAFFVKWFNDTARREELFAERDATYDPEAIFEHVGGDLKPKDTIRKEIIPVSIVALERRHWAAVLGEEGGQAATDPRVKVPFDVAELGLDPKVLPEGMPGMVSYATDAYEEDLRDTNMTEEEIQTELAVYKKEAYKQWANKFMRIELLTQHALNAKLDKDYKTEEEVKKIIESHKKSLKALPSKMPDMKKALEASKASNGITAEEYDEATKAMDSFNADEEIKKIDDMIANIDKDELEKMAQEKMGEIESAYAGHISEWKDTWYNCEIVTGPGDKFFLGMYATIKECDEAYARFEKRYNDAMALDEEEATLSSELMQKRR